MAEDNKMVMAHQSAIVPAGAPTDLLKLTKEQTAVNPIYEEKQLSRLFRATPKEHVHEREVGGGRKVPYVSGGYVRRELDVLFGFDWSFEIISVQELHEEIIVHGKLTGRVGEKTISKQQFGSAKLKYMKGSKDLVDYGNDCKAAATDALKKCAADFGIARDVYYANEFVRAQIIEAEVEEEVKHEEATAPVLEQDKTAIIDRLETLPAVDKMRMVKEVTGNKIKIDRDTLSDYQWKQLDDKLNNFLLQTEADDAHEEHK